MDNKMNRHNNNQVSNEINNQKSKIEKYFAKKKENNEKVLIPFIMAGDPDIQTTETLALEILENGGDILELGLPYSDPLADGPVIQQSAQRAKGTRIADVLKLVKNIRGKTDKPLVLLAYFNPIYNYGSTRFIDDFYQAGLNGLVIPDMAYEERDKLEKEAKGKLDLITFIAPTSKEEKLKEVAQRASGFIYCVSVAGVTGVREDFDFQVTNAINKIRKYTDVPLAIGFGISNPEQAKRAGEIADGVIVGSAIIKQIEKSQDKLSEVITFIKDLKNSLKS